HGMTWTMRSSPPSRWARMLANSTARVLASLASTPTKIKLMALPSDPATLPRVVTTVAVLTESCRRERMTCGGQLSEERAGEWQRQGTRTAYVVLRVA